MKESNSLIITEEISRKISIYVLKIVKHKEF